MFSIIIARAPRQTKAKKAFRTCSAMCENRLNSAPINLFFIFFDHKHKRRSKWLLLPLWKIAYTFRQAVQSAQKAVWKHTFGWLIAFVVRTCNWMMECHVILFLVNFCLLMDPHQCCVISMWHFQIISFASMKAEISIVNYRAGGDLRWIKRKLPFHEFLPLRIFLKATPFGHHAN